MKNILYPLGVAGTLGTAGLAGYVASTLVTDDPIEHAAAAGVAAALSTLLIRSPDEIQDDEDIILKLANLTWNMEDVCRGWLVTGRTGSGKTAAALANMMAQFTLRVPTWGGLCLDQKGDFFRMVQKVFSYFGREEDVVLLQLRPNDGTELWEAPFNYNWLERSVVPGSSYAQYLLDVAQARGAVGTGGSSDHFASQAKIHIGMAIEAIRTVGWVPTFPSVYEFLTSSLMYEVMSKLRALNTNNAATYFNHFTEKFLTLAGDELSGVKSTITNVLFFYQHPDVVQVFGKPKSTVDFNGTDRHKVFCCSIPQRFDAERGFLNTLMKMGWFGHMKGRFDLDEDTLAERNLNVLFSDEGQRNVTKSELGMADHNQIDQIRAAKGCYILSTQTERSLIPPLGKDIKNTLVDNLGNEIAFCQTNQEDAEILSKRIGERTIEKKSRTVGRQAGGFSESTSSQEKEEAFIKPHVLRSLKRHRRGSECIIRHCEKGWERAILPFTKYTRKMTAPSKVKQQVPITEVGQPYAETIRERLIAAGSREDLVPTPVLVAT